MEQLLPLKRGFQQCGDSRRYPPGRDPDGSVYQQQFMDHVVPNYVQDLSLAPW